MSSVHLVVGVCVGGNAVKLILKQQSYRLHTIAGSLIHSLRFAALTSIIVGLLITNKRGIHVQSSARFTMSISVLAE